MYGHPSALFAHCRALAPTGRLFRAWLRGYAVQLELDLESGT